MNFNGQWYFWQVLSEPRKSWIRDTTSKIYAILSETPQDGQTFVKHVKSILKYEEKWSKWKNEGCPSLAKLPDKVSFKLILRKFLVNCKIDIKSIPSLKDITLKLNMFMK